MPCPEPRFPEVPAEHFSDREGRSWLWGGSGDFDISDSELASWQLRHGIGREHFAALIAPEGATDPGDARWGANPELPG